MLRWFGGVVKIAVYGPAQTICLNRWTANDLPFWRFKKITELEFQCWCRESLYNRMKQEAARAQCEVKRLERRGFPAIAEKLKKRPVLTCGLMLSVWLAFFLQNFVWFVQIEDNQRGSEPKIRQALEDAGVHFGTWGPAIDSERLKNRILNEIPELSWIAVNRFGGIVQVLYSERNPAETKPEPGGIVNVVASRPGILREIHVMNGFSSVKAGDIVMPGDVLISGVMEWTTHIQATHARGEVYADTLRELELLCPAESLKKTYTGRTESCRSILFQRKRRKISGNSSIFGTMCDRMIEIKTLCLPNGYQLPVSLETVTLREYELDWSPLEEREAKNLLSAEALRLVEGQLVAGSIREGHTNLQMKQNSCSCHAAFNCLELISKSVPVELFKEEEDRNGKDHQRGAN